MTAVMSRHPRTAARGVLSVGLACLDIVNEVAVYPVEDTDTAHDGVREQLWSRGGNASNSAVILSQLGVATEFMGTLAKHVLTELIEEDLRKHGVEFGHCVRRDNCQTPVSCVILNTSTGSRTIFHGKRTLPELRFEDFKSIRIGDYSWIHFEGRNVPEVLKMIDAVDRYNQGLGESSPRVQISLEIEKPKWKAYLKELLAKADLIFISMAMALEVGCHSSEECLLKFHGAVKQGAVIVCAWGEQGAWAIEGNGNVLHSAAFPPPRVLDTLGAGDTFNGGVIAALWQGDDLQQAITQGCKVAGRKVGRHGFDLSADL